MLWKRRIYLDAAAGMSGNPSSPHEEGRGAKRMLEGARTTIARLTEVQSDDVIFTSGATEANALAILGLVKRGAHMLYLPSAHASIVENMKLAQMRGSVVEPLPVRDARVDTDTLVKMLRRETALVSMDAVCGETGVVWNTREVASVLREPSRAKRGIFLHVDASQAPLTEKLTRAHFDADMVTFDASKVSPTRGIGALIAHRTIPLEPLYCGGSQERGLRPGGESPVLATEFAAALLAAAKGREAFRAAALRARVRLVECIVGAVSGVLVNEGRVQAPHILNLSFPGRDTDYFVALLDEAGFAVSTRSACESASEEGSRAVFALTGDRERARATLRVSWGPDIRSSELDRFARALRDICIAFPAGGGSASSGIDSSGRR